MTSFRFSRALAAALIVVVVAPVAFTQADTPMPNPPPFPEENPMLTDQDTLGKFLFWEEQISTDNTMSCGTCHIHEEGGADPRVGINPGADGLFGTDDDVRGSPGVIRHDMATGEFVHENVFFPNAQVTGRKAPTAINSAYFIELFWDGRALQTFTDPVTDTTAIAYGGGVESQVAGPPTSDVEMSGLNNSWTDIATKLETVVPMAVATDLPAEMLDFLADNPSYPDMFEAVYGSDEITARKIIFAIANYERTLISDETILDDFLKGTIATFPPALEPGFLLFQGAANCATCHTLPFTMNNNFHYIGLRPAEEDIGREAVTLLPDDKGKMKTPNLRNAALRMPVFHNGSKNSFREVVEFYNGGGDFGEVPPLGTLDVEMFELNLTETEIDQLVLFLEETTTDSRVANAEFPFTRPTLRSELRPLNTTYGVASQDGVGGTALMFASAPANRGNENFLIGLDDARANAAALLIFSYADDPSGTPFPDPRTPVPVNIDLSSIFLTLPATADANGVATVKFPVPKAPALAGFKFYAQWLIEDVDAVATGGMYGSEGLEIEIL